MNNDDIQVDAVKVLEVIKEEHPMVFELALRRVIIETQKEMIAAMRERLAPEMAEEEVGG